MYVCMCECVCVCVCVCVYVCVCVCVCMWVFISFHRKCFSLLNKTNVMPEIRLGRCCAREIFLCQELLLPRHRQS